MRNISEYRKLWVAFVGALVGIVGRRYGVDSVAYTDIVAVLTAIGVYTVPNAPSED